MHRLPELRHPAACASERTQLPVWLCTEQDLTLLRCRLCTEQDLTLLRMPAMHGTRPDPVAHVTLLRMTLLRTEQDLTLLRCPYQGYMYESPQ